MYAPLVLNARVQDLHDEQDIVFPVTGSPFSTEAQFDFPRAQISIPPSVISESQPVIGEYVLNTSCRISNVSIFYRDLCEIYLYILDVCTLYYYLGNHSAVRLVTHQIEW